MLAYRIEGDGPPLLLIHGWGVTYAIWQNLAPLLRQRARLIMVELPGLGASPPADPTRPYSAVCAEELIRLREHLGIARWDVLGYSFGARVAEAYAHEDATHVRRAIFLCPPHLTGWLSLIQRRLIQLDRRFPALTNWVISGWRLNRLILLLGFNGHRHRYAAEWLEEIGCQSVASLKAAFYDLRGDPVAAPPATQIPALYIWGQYDRIARPPRHPHLNDWRIPADHSAPMLAASTIAREMIPFLDTPDTALPNQRFPLERGPRRRRFIPIVPLRTARRSMRALRRRLPVTARRQWP